MILHSTRKLSKVGIYRRECRIKKFEDLHITLAQALKRHTCSVFILQQDFIFTLYMVYACTSGVSRQAHKIQFFPIFKFNTVAFKMFTIM